jgi:cytosine/adenosine deaminase-related metal-dependent hydrolase
MHLRKFRSYQLFDGKDWLDENQVLVMDEAGFVQDLVPVAEAGEDVQWVDGILMPGMVNCHCHLELSHMQGKIPRHTGMVGFVKQVLTGRSADNEAILEAIAKAEESLLKNGIVAVGDISNTHHTLLQKSKSPLYYHTFVETTGFLPATASSRFQQAITTYNYFQAIDGPRHRSSLVPHAPYSVSEELFRLLREEGRGDLLSIHSQESEAEEQFFLSGQGEFNNLYENLGMDISFFQPYGTSSVQTVLPRFGKNNKLLLVHNVTTSEEDLNWIQDNQEHLPALYFCICPNANLYIGNGLPNLSLLRNSGIPLVLGTDSLASNSQLNIWEEIQTLRKSFVHIPLGDFLRWATYNGACALGLEDKIGSFEKGKQPGVIEIGKEINVLM